MKDAELNRLSGLLERFTPAVSVVAVAVGVLVQLGWLFDLNALKGVLPGLTFMKANTALGFILSGVALWPARQGAHGLRVVSQVCAGMVLLLGLLTLGEYLSGANFGIDQLLIRESTNLPGDMPGRMAFNTALSFAALGAALLLLSQEKGGQPMAVHALTMVPIIAAGSALVGYAFGIDDFLRERLDYTPMAIHAAVVFVLLALGVINARPDYPLRRLMTSGSAAGITVRRLLPAATGFTLVTGWLILQGCRKGYFNETFALALFTAASIAGLAALILWNAGILYEAGVQRDRMEESLRENEEQLNAIIKILPVGLWVLGADGKIVLSNDASQRIWAGVHYVGIDQLGEYKGWRLDSGKQVEPHEWAGARAVERGETSIEEEIEIECFDGSHKIILDSAVPLRRSDGSIRGAVTVNLDITGRKRAEEELRNYHEHLEELVRERTGKLEAANRDMEEFVYSISHDLRVPLRAVDGFSNMLLNGYKDRLDDEGKRLLNVVRVNTKRMEQLIDDILDFSRMDRMGMSVSVIDMEELVRTVFDELKPCYGGRALTMEIKPLPPCRGDWDMLRKAWSNLLSNAIKFTRPREAALIEVGGYSGEAENIYYVRDNGAGFDMQYAAKLFGVFQRLHGVEEFEGAGIGLAIVKRIITRHGGRVWAEGKVNEGATFYFALPVERKNT